MKASELMLELSQYHPDARVVIPGYEGGLEDMELIRAMPIVLNTNTESYEGPHEAVDITMPHNEVAVILGKLREEE